MNVTETIKTVREYAVTLSESDVAALLGDPYSWVDAFRQQFAPAPKPTRAQRGIHTPGIDHPGKKTRKAKTAPKASELRGCPNCTRNFKTTGRLLRHLKLEHPDSFEAASAAPAAEYSPNGTTR